MDDVEIEIPEYFLCPISLQIMRDPVTAITGITYDRRSIEHWIFDSHNSTCPVTKQCLPPDSDYLTPNHTLRRLIQSWCHHNGADRIPTPKSPLTRVHVTNLLKNLRNDRVNQVSVLRQLEIIAAENDRSRKHLTDAGVVRDLLALIVALYDEFGSRGDHVPGGIEEAVSILNFVRISSAERKSVLAGNNRIVESLTWILSFSSENHGAMRSHAVCVIRKVLEAASTASLERLEPAFFGRLAAAIRDRTMSEQAINAALRIMMEAAGASGRSRVALVDGGAVFEVVELELRSAAEEESKRTELVLGVLVQLCSCADGRAALLRHAAGMAVVAKKMLRVSPKADERAIMILAQICKHSSNKAVSAEMVRVGAAIKLFAVLQVGCAAHLKTKACEIIRSHYEDWKTSPCIGNNSNYLLNNFLLK